MRSLGGNFPVHIAQDNGHATDLLGAGHEQSKIIRYRSRSFVTKNIQLKTILDQLISKL